VTVTEEPAPQDEEPLRAAAAEPRETSPADAPAHEPAPDHASLAVAAAERGDCATALEHFGLARQGSPDDLDLRVGEAETYRRCGWPEVSLELLSELDARTRAREPVAFEIAEAHLALDRPGQAAMTWELRYILDPTAWRAAASAAEAWLEAGHHQPAQWWYEQAQRAAPDTPEVQALSSVFQSAAVTDR
jgi:Flp pilus assembly protein TadD